MAGYDLDREASGIDMKRKTSIRRKLAFALIPVLGLLIVTELILRVTGIADSTVMPLSLPGEDSNIHRADEHLFWAMWPGVEVPFQGVTVTTNSRGLRNAELRDKRPGEFRILSLGESTTFGAKVENDETYSAQLQAQLNRRDPAQRFNVINAGVSGYTSFQSLIYLKRHGLALAPDLVLFYHELNDYMPTTEVNVKNTVIGESLTDKQRYLAKRWRLHRQLLARCATYRAIHFLAAHIKIKRFKRAAVRRGPGNWQVIMGVKVTLSERPGRVSPAERSENFEELWAMSQAHGFQLVMIHPSYRGTIKHECELTEFCAARGVPMFESHEVLHPTTRPPGALYWDSAHPVAQGHALLAEALAQFLVAQGLVPADQ